MKHKPIPFTQSITDFFGMTNKSAPTTNKSGERVSSSVAIPEQTSDVSSLPVSPPSTSMIISEEVLHAVLWVIKVISSDYSFISCTDISCLFSIMVPDSQIVQSFSCGATKYCVLAFILIFMSCLWRKFVQSNTILNGLMKT